MPQDGTTLRDLLPALGARCGVAHEEHPDHFALAFRQRAREPKPIVGSLGAVGGIVENDQGVHPRLAVLSGHNLGRTPHLIAYCPPVGKRPAACNACRPSAAAGTYRATVIRGLWACARSSLRPSRRRPPPHPALILYGIGTPGPRRSGRARSPTPQATGTSLPPGERRRFRRPTAWGRSRSIARAAWR